jgi:CheY-like chemotaxis protein
MSVIMVVEDHPLNRKLVRDVLQIQFEVDEAASAESALERLITGHIPDLILTDIQLPAMDGLTLIRRLKADPLTAAIPVIALSAGALPRDIQQARDAGCVDYITKPITDDVFTFLERIARGLAAPADCGRGGSSGFELPRPAPAEGSKPGGGEAGADPALATPGRPGEVGV